MTWLPAPANVEDIHNELVEIFIEESDPIAPAGVKTKAMLESACARPHTGIAGHEKYKTIFEKLAALFHSLTKNHPFHNGNKRTAVASILTALYRNDYILKRSVTDDDIYDLAVNVTADEFPCEDHGLPVDEVIQELAVWIRDNAEAINPNLSSMTLKAFIKRCEEAGARIKYVKGGSVAIMNGDRSIKIARSTRRLDGPAISVYLKRLNLSESSSGITGNEFQDGVSPEQAQIKRYIVALRRLAKT
ncbi:type II toxin-antitoxin system death-on-curing family toxin [Ralstonia solanacearum]|uniref:type II toxin-antitoxin system death-on-curing family toxin n=1 Tax=Ralstonia solanacearum TaxID=305 RepID=UPI0009B88FCD|nr:type II toxin-antitoxin system death-on-curing family toxin [Ralstonia solanacearum]